MTRRRLCAVAASLVLLAAACGDDEAASTSTTTVPPTTAATTTAAPTTTSPSTTTTSSTTTTTTAPPPAGPPAGSILVTGEDGVYVAAGPDAASQIITADPSVPIAFAIDDTRGGVIFQPNRGPWQYEGDDSIVYWIPAGAAAAQELLVPAADQGLALEDVAAQGETVGVYYTRVEGKDAPETARQTLRRFDLDAGTVEEVAVVGGWESGSSPISVGGDTIVENSGAEGYIWIDFTNLGGVEFESPANPLSVDEFDCFPECFYYADLSPDGTRVALARLAPNANGFPTTPEIEIRNVATGALELSVTLPDVGAFPWIDSLDLSDTHVLINIVEEGSVYPIATIVDLASGGLDTYLAPVGGVARFLRSAPELGGVVNWP